VARTDAFPRPGHYHKDPDVVSTLSGLAIANFSVLLTSPTLINLKVFYFGDIFSTPFMVYTSYAGGRGGHGP